MTNESNENLLKILLNRPAEEPESNTGYFEIFDDTLNILNTNMITYDQLQYNGYTIGLYEVPNTSNAGYVFLYNKEGTLLFKKKPVSNGVEYNVLAIDIDSEGNLYGIIADSTYHLAYFNNVFVPDTNGNYDIHIKKRYSLGSMFATISQTIGSALGQAGIDIKKSPIDSSFLITESYVKGSSNYTLLSILYHVNFEGENTYEYKYGNIGSYNYAWIKNVEPTWTNGGVSFSDVILSTSTNSIGIKSAEFYKVTGTLGDNNNDPLGTTLMVTESNYYDTEFREEEEYISISKNAVQKGDDIYFVSNAVVENDITTYIYHYNTNIDMIWAKAGVKNDTHNNMANMIKVNNECFAWVCTSQSTGEKPYNTYFLHLVDDDAIEYEITPSGAGGVVGNLCLIQNSYNLYDILMTTKDITISIPHGILIYRSVGYNGDPYFNDEATTQAYSTLYNYYSSSGYSATIPIFSRDLYNATKIGNTITSVVQVPYNYLNNVIINKTDILSKTANTINESIKPIDKNMYEELYINNQNAYKVFDNNIGSTYNQEATLNVVSGIFDSFNNNYKITKYRINYNDGTYENKPVMHTNINDNIGTISMYIYLPKPAKNIQLYDDNFTVPFLTIDISNFDIEKIYQIVQKIRVE